MSFKTLMYGFCNFVFDIFLYIIGLLLEALLVSKFPNLRHVPGFFLIVIIPILLYQFFIFKITLNQIKKLKNAN